MNAFKAILFILLIGLITGCGKSSKKSENIGKDDLIGRWQPEKIEFRDIPVFIKKQIPDDLEKELLTDAQKEGYLELKNDGTFIIKETPKSEEIAGKWSFSGDKKIEIESEKLKALTGNKDLKIGFDIEFLSDDKLEIDYASAYKIFGELNNIPFLGVKMVMTYKRIK